MAFEKLVLSREKEDGRPGPGQDVNLLPDKENDKRNGPVFGDELGSQAVGNAQPDKHQSDEKKKSPGPEKPSAQKSKIG
jgi:hypothetical protein